MSRSYLQCDSRPQWTVTLKTWHQWYFLKQSLKMSEFSFKMLFKKKKTWSFLIISTTGSHNDPTGFAVVKLIHFSRNGSCVFVTWQPSLSLSKVKLWEWPWVPFTEAIFVPQSSPVLHSKAHLHQPGADLDDPPLLPPCRIFRCYFDF